MLTVDLERQLAGYGEQLETYIAPFSIEKLTGEAPFEPRPPTRQRPRWVIALTAALVVLLVVGGAAVAIRLLSGEGPVVDEPTPTTLPTPTSVPGPSEDASGQTLSAVHDEGVAGAGVSMVLDSAGNPVLVYQAEGSLWLARCGDPGCVTAAAITEVAPIDVLVDDPISLALLADGSAVVSYVEPGPPTSADQPGITVLKLAGSTGVTEIERGNTTGRNGGRGLGVAAGLPVLAYYTWTGERGEVVILTCGDAACSVGNTRVVVDVATGFTGLDLAIDSEGNPVVAYSMWEGTGSLRLARCSDPTCASGVTVTTLVDVQTAPPSLGFGSAGLPVVFTMGGESESGFLPGQLIFCDDPRCDNLAQTQIDELSDPDLWRGQLSLRPDDLPLLTWVDANQLWIAECLDQHCTARTISATGVRASRDGHSAALGTDGLPIVALATGSDVAVLRCDESLCAPEAQDETPAGDTIQVGGPLWTVDTVVPTNVGGFINATLQPDGSPFLVYQADTGALGPEGEVSFAVGLTRCVDSGCMESTSWSTPELELFEAGVVVPGDGLPLFTWDSFFTSDGEGAAVGKCLDPVCNEVDTRTVGPASMWFAPEVVLGSDGLPMLVYQDLSETSPIFVALCADPGCVESTVNVLEDPGSAGPFSLAIDPNGLLAVAYAVGNGEFRLARCSDPVCAEVTIEVFDDTGGNEEAPAKLAFGTNGLPVIGFDANNEFKIASCLDPTCSEATVRPIASHLSGFVQSLMLGPDGNPVVFYRADGVEWAAICSDAACAEHRTFELQGIPRLMTVLAGKDGLPLLVYQSVSEAVGDPEFGQETGDLVVAKCTDPACLGL